MKVKSVEITEHNGKSTIKINGEELQGVTYFEFKKAPPILQSLWCV